MKTVFESQGAVEAHMILHLLQGAGIEGQVLGEFLQGGTGELPATRLVRVVVADDVQQIGQRLQPIADATRAPAADRSGQP